MSIAASGKPPHTEKQRTMTQSLFSHLRRIHRFLLPDEPHIGWSPYLWLLYLAFLVPALLANPFQSITWGVTLASIPVFLILYFRAFWRQGRALLFNIALMSALAAVVMPVNQGATVYFIYAAASAPFIGSVITALSVITGLAAILVFEALFLGHHLLSWLIPAFILVLVGVSNIYYCEMARKNAHLRLTQDEVSRLATVAERERIARDLHDLLGQTLSLIAIKAELVGRLIALDTDRAQREINELEKVTREALKEVRKAVTGFRHSGLDRELDHARLTLKASGIRNEVASDPYELSASQETVLAMALREAVTNVIRHAQATRCRIAVTSHPDEVVLQITDNGRGGKIIVGNGLTGMRERLEHLGGSVEFTIDHGLTVTVHLPLQPTITPLRPWNHAA